MNDAAVFYEIPLSEAQHGDRVTLRPIWFKYPSSIPGMSVLEFCEGSPFSVPNKEIEKVERYGGRELLKPGDRVMFSVTHGKATVLAVADGYAWVRSDGDPLPQTFMTEVFMKINEPPNEQT